MSDLRRRLQEEQGERIFIEQDCKVGALVHSLHEQATKASLTNTNQLLAGERQRSAGLEQEVRALKAKLQENEELERAVSHTSIVLRFY